MTRAHACGRLSGLVVVAVLSCTAAAAAQSKDAFARRDTNNDGHISLQEWTASGERAVRRLDTNGDGKVSRAEFMAFQKQRAARLADSVFRQIEANGGKFIRIASIDVDRRRKRLSRFDADGDGLITRAELQAGFERAARRRMTQLFKRFDGNGDGLISRAEREAINDRRFASLDTNGDGRLTRDELAVAQNRFRARAEQRQRGNTATVGSKAD